MPVSRTALRLIALLFLLAGVLLLRNPSLANPSPSHPHPNTFLPRKNLSVLGHSFPIMDTCSSGGHRTPH
jgi:hypothetical protein